MRWVGLEAVYLKRFVAFVLGGVLVCTALVVAGTSDMIPSTERLLVHTQASSGSGDAGSGTDASDAKSAPTLLAGPGQYDGALHSEDDVDWFGLSADSADLCVEATASGSATTQVTLDLPGLSTIRTQAHKGQDRSVDMALAGAGASEVRFGFTKANDQARAPGDWSFGLQTFAASELLAEGDAGAGSDAGDTVATASTIGQGCAGGSLSGGDTADVYSVDAEAGEIITLSLSHASGSGDLRLDLVDATGSVLMSLEHNDAGSHTFDEGGTYYLKVHDTSDDTSQTRTIGLDARMDPLSEDDDGYLLGLDGPEPRPCDPGC